MRCRDAKNWLSAQRDGELEPSHANALQEHLTNCASCRALAHDQRLIDTMIGSMNQHVSTADAPLVRPASISTNQIMRAIQQQKHITCQLEDLREQQLLRIARMRKVGTVSAALGFLILSSIPLLFLVIAFLQTDLALKALSLFNGVIDGGIVLGQYAQIGLTLVTRDNLLLSGLAFAVVVMMGMWLRLMRSPQEV
jgi:anti-sigma factor RsiW